MRKKENSLALLGVVVLLFFGYSIPTVAMAMEDRGLLKEAKSIEIDEIKLNVQSMDVVETLDVFPDVLMNNIVVETATKVSSGVSGGHTESQEQMSSTGDYEKIQSSIEFFWNLLHVEKEIEFVEFTATHYIMMVASDDERVCSLWKCHGMDENKQEYVFWIEDTSGKILAFVIPFHFVGMDNESFYMSMGDLGQYYGFSNYGLKDFFTEVYEMNYWENYLYLFDEQDDVKVNITLYKNRDKLYFNLYPQPYDYESLVY